MIEKTGLPDIFPFHSLLTLLEGSGFRFGVDTRVRLGEYWQLVAKDEQLRPAEIKVHLSALLCRSVEELERFEHIFNMYVPPGLKPLNDWKDLPSPPRPAPIENKPTETTPGQPDEGPKPPPPPPPPPSKSTERLGAVLPMLIFPEEPFRIWNLRGMSDALMLLQEKVLTETTEWDVPGTIGAIMRAGGYPKLAYRRRRQAPRYLVLIEQQSPRDHLAGYAAELVKEINHRDLEVAYYFFDKNPGRCWKVWRDPLTHVNLELLKSEWNGARLLLLSHASCFINPATGTPSNLALDLPDHFSNVALLATNSPLEWGAAERSLQTLVPVLPMSVEGLGHLMAAWNGESQLRFGDWQVMLPEPVPTQLSGAAAQRAPAEVFMDVYRYLGKDAFRWLCACAVYPEIYFELTSILHDEAIPPLADLSEWEQHEQWNQAMRLLSRLYWFRRGYLPSTMLDDLKRNLKPADLALVEGEIRRILEISKNWVGETTHAASIRQRMFDWMAEQGFRVLWIDDNPENNQQMIDSWSKSLGILFRQATSTDEAASLLETERFELVISDIGRKGEEKPADATIRMVNRQSPAPPVVFFTDERGMRLRGTLMEAGAYQVTDDIGELQQALSAVWDRKFKPVEEVQQKKVKENPYIKKTIVLKTFIAYSHKDRSYCEEMQKHLSVLESSNKISLWHDGMIEPGKDWDKEIRKKLNESDIFLLLVSADFLSSEYFIQVELGEILKRQRKGEAVIVPIMLRHSLVELTELKNIQSIWVNGEPVDNHSDRDYAWADVARQIEVIVDEKLGIPSNLNKDSSASQSLNQTAQDQEMLKKLGFYEGEIDGTPGEQFRSAISRFQRENKLVADGIVGGKTREAMRKAVERLEAQQQQQQYQQTTQPPPLNQTTQDQEMLKKLGYYKGEINGKTDKLLRKAISDFQRVHGLMADGILGPQTREVMNKELEHLESPTIPKEELELKAMSVCRITRNGKIVGNGFLVGNGYVFTSKATLPNKNSLNNAKAYTYDFRNKEVISFTFNLRDYIAGQSEDDFVRVRIAGNSVNLPIPPLGRKRLGTGDKVSVVYYLPSGDLVPKYLNLADVIEFSDEWFTYETSNMLGVIGAPVFNESDEVVGVTVIDKAEVKRGRFIGSTIRAISEMEGSIRNLLEIGEIEKALIQLTLLYPDNVESSTHNMSLDAIKALQQVDFGDGGTSTDKNKDSLKQSIIRSLDYLGGSKKSL